MGQSLSMMVIDTHSLVWYLTKDKRLSNNAEDAMKKGGWVIPFIVLVELQNLQRKGKTNLDYLDVYHTLREMNCVIAPLDVKLLPYLDPSLNIHDRLIVAIAKCSNIPIVSKNKQIIDNYSNVIW